MALSQHTFSGLMLQCDQHGTPWRLMHLPLAQLRVSFMWFSRFSMTCKMCTLVARCPCAFGGSREQPRASLMHVVHFKAMRDRWAPSFRLSEHASCFALRLLSHLLYHPSTGLADAAHLLLQRSFSQRSSGCSEWKRRHADSFTWPSTLVFEVPSVFDQGHRRRVRSSCTARGTGSGP